MRTKLSKRWRSSVKTVVICMLTVGLGCGGPGRGRAGSGPTEWSSTVAPVLDRDDRVSLEDHVDMLGIPIRVWFFQQDARITRVRVVGHGDEETCGETSLALWEALSDPVVDGFLSFGVGELVPKGDADGVAFDARMQALRVELDHIADEHAAYLEVREVSATPDGILVSPPPIPTPALVAYGFAGSISAAEGPTFAPLRSWDGVSTATAEPIEVDVTAKELGIDDALVGRLAKSIKLEPQINQVVKARQLLEASTAYEQWVRGGAQVDLSVGGIAMRPKPDPTAFQVREAIMRAQKVEEALILFVQVVQSMGVIVPNGELMFQGEESRLRRILIHVRQSMNMNRLCLEMLTAGAVCPRYEEITILPLPTDAQEFLAALSSQAREGGLRLARKVRAAVNELVKDREQKLDRVRRAVVQIGELERESVVDALLRAWPFSTGSAADDARIDAIIDTKIPQVHAELRRVLASKQIEVSTERVGGDLVGPSIFYRVRDLGNGSFRVTPTYIVHGDYIERWSPQRHTVTIVRPNE